APSGPRRPPRSPLLPYTTLFRSNAHQLVEDQPAPLLLIGAQERRQRLLPGVPPRGSAAQDVVESVGAVDPPTRRLHRLQQLAVRSEEHTSELQSRENLVCRLLLD